MYTEVPMTFRNLFLGSTKHLPCVLNTLKKDHVLYFLYNDEEYSS